MSDIFVNIIIIIMGIMGGVSSLYVIVSLPAVLLWKLYRMIFKGYKFSD